MEIALLYFTTGSKYLVEQLTQSTTFAGRGQLYICQCAMNGLVVFSGIIAATFTKYHYFMVISYNDLINL